MDRPSRSMNAPHATDAFLRFGESLLARPAEAVADLLAGRAALGAQQRAEPEDFLADLLAYPAWDARRADLTERLDGALRDWLLGQIGWGLEAVARHGTRAYVAELADGLAIAARLPLTRTAAELIKHQVAWDNRLSGLRWPGDIDLWRQFNLVLIQHQPDTRFVARWFAACERAAWGGPQWRGDLATGLLGLRKLPHPPDSRPERPVASALARFAVLAQPRGLPMSQVESAFRRGAGALLALYPRQSQHWQDLWSEVLDDLGRVENQRPMVERIKGHWLSGVLPATAVTRLAKQRKTGKGSARGGTRLIEPPSRHELDALIGVIGRAREPDTTLLGQISVFMGRHWAYADLSGNGYFAVRTLHNLATRLLRLAPDAAVLTQIHAWTLRAIEIEPGNPFVWGLWGQVLAELGDSESALAVRWETVRRFPDDPVLRVELADLLRRRNRPALAEYLLRETMRDFPRDEVCRNTLADLLRETNRAEEAEQVLRETIRDFPRDVVCRHQLTLQLWRQHRRDEAAAVLAEAESIAPKDGYVLALGKMVRGESEPSEEFLAEHVLPRPFFLKAAAGAWEDLPGATEPDESPAIGAEPVDPGPSTAEFAASPRNTGDEAPVKGPTPSASAPADPAVAGARPPLPSFFAEITRQVPLIQAYFTGMGVASADDLADLLEAAGASEVALVAAHRAGALDGPEGRALLANWTLLKPQSFPARLLSVNGSDAIDEATLEALGRDFPDRRASLDPLWLAVQPPAARHAYLEGLRSSRAPSDQRLWDGRIEEVFPDVAGDAERPGLNQVAWRRLVEDIALAQSARAVQSVAIV